jgi:hypothetical protein
MKRDSIGAISFASEQRRRNDGAGLQHIGACRRLDAVGAHGAAVDIAVQEGELAILRGRIA